MATYYYVKGDPVQNAQGYELWKGSKKTENVEGQNIEVFVPSDNGKIETQEILKQLVIPGAIGENGKPAERSQTCFLNDIKTVYPVTELTEEGYVHYVRVSGHMNIHSEMAPIMHVPFQGKYYIDKSYIVDNNGKFSPVEFMATGLSVKKPEGATKASIYLSAILLGGISNLDIKQDIKVYGDIDRIDNLYVEIDSSLTPMGDVEYDYVLYSAHEDYRRTDFIPIEGLTDHLRGHVFDPENPYYYCVGAFHNDGNAIGAYKIAFYDGMAYSTFKAGLRWNETDFQYPYLTKREIENIRNDEAPDAKYVIFSSSRLNEEGEEDDNDFVSVGGVSFMLTNNAQVQAGDILGVKAKGDGTFFADSDFSNPVTYNPQS